MESATLQIHGSRCTPYKAWSPQVSLGRILWVWAVEDVLNMPTTLGKNGILCDIGNTRQYKQS